MAMERVPYLVGGGFEHSAEVMRAMLAASTSGAEGIVNAGDFKVRPLAVPGTSVRVAPGNALIRNSYGGGQAQTYACRAGSETVVAIEATGSAGSRTDLIVARIDDPTYQGGAFDPLTFEAARFEVIQGVPASTKTVAGLGLSYPAIALARVTLPASTGTVTAGMITDLRKLAQPRKERHLFIEPLVTDDGNLRLYSTETHGQVWPNTTSWRVDVPSWAQRMRVVANWGGVLIRGVSEPANAYGTIWARLGSGSTVVDTQRTGWNISDAPTDNVRESWMTGDDHAVPAALRGVSDVTLELRGRVTVADDLISKPLLDAHSVASLDVEFYETAV